MVKINPPTQVHKHLHLARAWGGRHVTSAFSPGMGWTSRDFGDSGYMIVILKSLTFNVNRAMAFVGVILCLCIS